MIPGLMESLSSTLPHDQVRTWLWIKCIMDGECDVMDVLAQFGSDTALIGLMRQKLVSMRGTRIIAAEWGVRSSFGVTGVPIVRNSDTSTHTREPESTDSRVSSTKRSSESASTKLDRTRSGKKKASDRFSRLSGRDRLLESFLSPKAAGAREVQAEAAEWVFRAYNRARKESGVRPLPASQASRYRAQTKEIARFVLESEIKLGQFLAFAQERTAWQKTAFVTLHVLAGTWIRSEWENRDEKRKPKHAGHSYVEVDDGLRGRLVAAGFESAETLSDDDIGYIEEQAVVLRDRPEHYTPDPELDPLVQWVAKEG